MLLARRWLLIALLSCAPAMFAADRPTNIFEFNKPPAPASKPSPTATPKAIDQAIIRGDYDEAIQLATAADTAARATSDAAKIAAAAQRLADIKALQAQAAKAAPAIAKLANAPDDAQANLEAGRFLCFWRGDWSKGLPLLAKGSDADLKALAQEDLAAGIDVSMQFGVANAWWEYAEHLAGPPQSYARDRAAEVYLKAIPRLEGTNRTTAQQRIAAAPIRLPFPRVAVPGSVAVDDSTPIASTIQVVADDFVCDIYHNGKLIPAENRKLQGEIFGAQGELVTADIKPGDWIVFNVANNRLRWNGVYYFAAAGLTSNGNLAFTSELRSGNWSACDDLKEISRFVSQRDYLKDHAAQAIEKSWDVNDEHIRKGNPDWNGQGIWGDPASRSTWLKFIVPGGENAAPAATK